jgi:hypothetical protein
MQVSRYLPREDAATSNRRVSTKYFSSLSTRRFTCAEIAKALSADRLISGSHVWRNLPRATRISVGRSSRRGWHSPLQAWPLTFGLAPEVTNRPLGSDTQMSSVCCHLLTMVPRSRIFLPWRWRRYVPPKRRFTHDLHGATTQKTAFFNPKFVRLLKQGIQRILASTFQQWTRTNNRGYTQYISIFSIDPTCRMIRNYCLGFPFVGHVNADNNLESPCVAYSNWALRAGRLLVLHGLNWDA